jgi:molybdopterin molybdotransferase
MPELFTVCTPDEANLRLAGYLRPAERRETVAVAQALDRVTAEGLHAPADLPAFPRSTMDGYALRAADSFGASESLPAYLEVAGEVPMGQPARVALRRGQVAKVHTGSMLPDGADAVVMVENTQEIDARTIEVVRPVAPGENTLRTGEDVARGDLLVPVGHRLRPQDIGGLLGVGITEVAVARRPVVGLLATGDEIVPPEAEPAIGQIRDINTYTLAALVRRAGGTPLPLGIVADDAAALRQAAAEGLARSDVLILSAGSSVSTRDLTSAVIGSLGPPGVLVHGVSLRPGKPTILAMVGDKPVFGLPGNPVSAMVTFDLFVRPALHTLLGLREPPPANQVEAVLTHNVASAAGREDYVQVRLQARDGVLEAEPVFGKSNLIYTLVRADGVLRVPLDSNGIVAGERVVVRLF